MKHKYINIYRFSAKHVLNIWIERIFPHKKFTSIRVAVCSNANCPQNVLFSNTLCLYVGCVSYMFELVISASHASNTYMDQYVGWGQGCSRVWIARVIAYFFARKAVRVCIVKLSIGSFFSIFEAEQKCD